MFFCYKIQIQCDKNKLMYTLQSDSYNAPKPKYSNWEWFKFIALRIVFPPVLLWDLIKLGVNKLIGELVGGWVLPAQNNDFICPEISEDIICNDNKIGLTFERHRVITHDAAHLDTFEITHNSQTKLNPKYQKYIINLVGNGTCYEQIINTMKQDASDLGVNVIGFNFRGVGKSTGKTTSKDNLFTDATAQVQRLLDKGVSPQNIVLKGHSLGAAIGSLVTQHFHQLKQPINVFSSRSFSTITNVLVGYIPIVFGYKDRKKGTILGWLAKPFVKLAVTLANWEINAGRAFKSIPELYREYIVVRTKKEIRIRDNWVDDKVIPHYASIHKALTAERRAKKVKIDREIKNLADIIKSTDPLAKPDITKAKEYLIEAREKIKSDRKMQAYTKDVIGHNVGLNELHNRRGVSAQAFFQDFVQKAAENHAIKSAPEIR